MSNMFAGSLVAMLCVGLFALALGALGVVLIVLYLRQPRKSKASGFWTSTTGKITGNKIRVDETQDDGSVRYLPEVYFEYEVDGARYEGKRVAFGSEPSFPSRKKVEAFLEAYPEEKSIDVFYNPEVPGEAVLSQTMRKMTANLIVGVLLMVVMLCFLCPVMFGLVNSGVFF